MDTSDAHDDSGRFQSAAEADYTNPSKEQVLRADLEERWQDTQGPWYCREAIVAALRGPSISRLVVYCTGDWNAERQAAHAAQVKLLEA